MTLVFDRHDHWRIDTESPQRAQDIISRMSRRWRGMKYDHRGDLHFLKVDPVDFQNMLYKAEQFGRNCRSQGYAFSWEPRDSDEVDLDDVNDEYDDLLEYLQEKVQSYSATKIRNYAESIGIDLDAME